VSGETIASGLAATRARIAAACARAGRRPDEVTLVAVSKTHPASAVAEAALAGQAHFGENRVQEARAKIPDAPPGLVWHLVGSLQRNKARDAAALFSWVHSLDSLELGRELDRRLGALGKRMEALVEVRLSPAAGRAGVEPEGAADLVRGLLTLPNLSVRGMMGMPPPDPDPEAARLPFRALGALRREVAERLGLERFDQLSMGMSLDLEPAVEEGATLVRVGAAIFGRRG
jgi:pyridoxal phosphate enzyme (YggS family)